MRYDFMLFWKSVNKLLETQPLASTFWATTRVEKLHNSPDLDGNKVLLLSCNISFYPLQEYVVVILESYAVHVSTNNEIQNALAITSCDLKTDT